MMHFLVENTTTFLTQQGNSTINSNVSSHSNNEKEKIEQIVKALHIFSLIIYSVAFLLGTTGNGLVIYFSAFKMKRTVNVVWFLNLAIADFIFTFFLPLSIIYLALGFHWPFGTFMCKLNSSIAFINMYASVFLLTIISFDRCISVIFPVWCQNHRTPRMASIMALGAWILAVIFSSPYFIFRNTVVEDGRTYCFNNFEHEDTKDEDYPSDVAISRHRGTVTARFIVGFAIPFMIIVFCYSIIIWRIRRNHMATSSKPFKIIFAVLISFFICWFPYHIFSFLEVSHTYDYENDDLLYPVYIGVPLSSSLAFINSCVNPVLYVFMGQDFKQKFRSSFQSIFEKAFMEENIQTDFQSKTKSTSDSHML